MRRIGLILHKDDDSGIAKISVVDLVSGDFIVENEFVDLYQADQDATFGNYEEFVFWVTLPYDDVNRYQWSVTHSGYNNPYCMGPNYAINYNGYIIEEEYTIGANIGKTLILKDSSSSLEYNFSLAGYTYSSTELQYNVVKEALQKLYITVNFVGDGTTTLYQIGGQGLKCYKFIRWSTDGGVNWNEPYHVANNWGSNSSYDDEIIKDGVFYVEFLEPPDNGASVLFDVVPIFDKVTIELQVNQPMDASLYDYAIPVSLLDYSLEFIK